MGAYAQTYPQLQEQLRRAAVALDDRQHLAGVHRLAVELFTGQYRGSERPFTTHLVGTASVLLAHAAPLPVVAAGLLHAAYERGDFGRRRRDRSEVARVAGEEAERHVHAYTTRRWDAQSIREAAAKADTLAQSERHVLMMRLANELDDHLDCAVLYCADGTRRRAFMMAIREPAARLARALGHDALATELEAAFDSCQSAEVPAALQGAHGSSYAQPSRTCGHGLASSLRAFVRRRG